MLDLCESLKQTTREPLQVVTLSAAMVRVVLNQNHTVEPAQSKRVVDSLNQAITKNPQLTILLLLMGNLQENQGNYLEAEGFYRRATRTGQRGRRFI